MNKLRPVNLNLWTIRFPITAIVSILHRLTGCFLFLLIPAGLALWGLSLRDPLGFLEAKTLLVHPIGRLSIWIASIAFFYHGIATIRHWVMDIGFGESLMAACASAYGILLVTLGFAIWLGVGLW